MSADLVFATAKPGEAFVFRHNFSENKWENVASKNGSSTVTFRKRDGAFFIRIAPDGGDKEEHQLSAAALVKDSGQGFIQVPLPDRRQIIGIKFNSSEQAAIFLAKIRAEMSVQGPVNMQAVTLDNRSNGAMTMAPNPDMLPKAIGYTVGPTTLPTSRNAAPPPEQHHRGNVIEATDVGSRPPPTLPPSPALRQPNLPPSTISPLTPSQYHTDPSAFAQQELRSPPNQYTLLPSQPPGQQFARPAQPALHPVQPALHPVQLAPNPVQLAPNPGQVAHNPGQVALHPVQLAPNPGQVAHNPGQVAPNLGQLAPNMGHPVDNPGQLPQAKASVGVTEAPQPKREFRSPVHRADPETPSFSSNGELSDHATFLTNAINTSNFEAAHKMINLLQKMMEQKTPQRRMTISYSSNSRGPSAEDEDVKLHLSIEFQSQHKRALQLYLDFKSSLRISDIQQHLELSHHIPKATQNWIIGDNLVKGDQLNQTLRDFGIAGEGTTGKVFIYVMHSKKAHVPKEEYEAIRQCQQEEWERKTQGRRHPWQQLTPPPAPPDLPPRSRPPQQYPPPTGRTLEPAGQMMVPGHLPQPREAPPPRRIAWAPPPGEDTYSRANHHIPAPAVAPPPQRRQVDFDPTYKQLQNFPQHPAEGLPRPPQATPTQVGYPRPPVGGAVPRPSHQPPLPLHQQPVMGYHQEPPVAQFQAPPPQPRPQPRPPPPVRPLGWSCPKCTFLNKPRRPGCEICSADRPTDYKIPEDAPIDADEARIMAGLQEGEHKFQEMLAMEGRREGDRGVVGGCGFLQFAVAEKQERERERARNFQALVRAEEESLILNEEEFDCPVCFDTVPPGEGVTLRNCLHQFCKECLKETIMRSPEAEVKCPFIDKEYECNAPLPEREIKQLLTEEELQELYKRGLRQAESAAANSYHCKTTDCEGFCFYEDEVNHFHCPLCKKVNCLTCKAIHEGMNCQEYQEDLKTRAANDEAAKATQEMLEKMVVDGEAMHCPSCKIVVQKKDGCDWIRCSVCKTEICWATKQARWGPKGKGDKSGGCHCRENNRKCHPLCRNCH